MKIDEIMTQIEINKDKLEFIPTGFSKLDSFLDGGLLKKELAIIGGASGSGKSYLAGQIFFNVASKGFKSLYLSLEISSQMIVSRLIGNLADIKPTKIIAGAIDAEERQRVNQAKQKISTYDAFMEFEDNIYYFDEIKKKIVESKADFVVIDFIQNIMIKGLDEYTRLSQISLELQKLAKEQDCVIVCLSQLSNQAAKEGDKSPVVEYRGAGTITQVCDLGFWIQKDQSQTDRIKLMLRKNRRGVSGVSHNLVAKYPGGLFEEASYA